MNELLKKMARFGLVLLENKNDVKIITDFCNIYYEFHKELPNEILCFAYLDYYKKNSAPVEEV